MAITGFDLAADIYSDDDKARELLERLRWPQGPRCVKCGSLSVYKMGRMEGSSSRKGLIRCRDCEQQFSVTVGTIFEDSHIGLGKWFMAIHLMCASKKGMSAHQLHRMLGVTYKTAWFMAHRIRYAMTQEPLSRMLAGTVEADETYVGGLPKNRHARKREPAPPKAAVLSLVERGGDVRSFHVADVTGETLRSAIDKNVSRKARMMTDGAAQYKTLGRDFAAHEAVDHVSNEYLKGEAHTNTVEGYFSILKRGIVGTYHHVSKAHLHRYLAEFDQRYNTRKIKDRERAARVLKGIEGKRLTYKPLVNRKG
jgi:transposase-like protein